ncbi:MAG: DEAD/DEAH box helicase [Proteobacteria bacterium]|nr:DEAD/DEAH box helicase [Pseudomonadota bacterium]
MNTVEFSSLLKSVKLLRALNARGYSEATPIQAQSIPHLIEGRDLLGIAQTGTGKTAAFALPMLQKLDSLEDRPQPRRPRSLILAPTRELVLQILEEFALLGKHTGVRCVKVIGGVGAQPQVKALSTGCDVLIATPGRLLDLANSRHVDLSQVATLVLDEADRLLDMGFIRDVKKIIKMTPDRRQTLLFSATMPKEVAELAREILKNPIRVDVSPKQVTVDKIDQRVVHVSNGDKQRMLETMLHAKEVTRAIVFTRTKHGANKVAKKLEQAGIVAEAIHGNKSQAARQRALASFKNGDCWVLVATDIAARGIDVSGVSHVFNHELPHEPESYVHRIGRTARAGADGVAVSLVDSSERPRLQAIEKLIKHTLSKVTVDLPPIDPSSVVVNPVHLARPVTRSQPTARAGGQEPGRRRRRRRANNTGTARV